MMYIWKEWKEQSRGKGIWLSLSVVVLLSLFLLLQSRSFPSELGYQVFLFSLYQMCVYLLPLLSLFLASFAIMQEKEQKTLLILLTKKESYRQFFLKKSIAVQFVSLSIFIGWFFFFSLPSRLFLPFDLQSLMGFLLTVSILLIIFNQIGMLLGSICSTRMQLVGANIFTWFLLVFLIDLVFLYALPSVNKDNIFMFSILYFLDPLHTLSFYLETTLGLFSLNHLSRLMEKMVWMPPASFLVIDFVLLVLVTFELAIRFRSKGDKV
ncbi:ABC transporter permease subunit [Brevibacillus sp. SYSU BS000544]|uniref:ABC transporter permease subunit n=1 Tax=Brevibacillus sp. SYSU BS000544 TaxID=3416443 RepID=UPI003CE4C774